MNKKTLIIIGIVALVVLIGLAVWIFSPGNDVAPTGAAVADIPKQPAKVTPTPEVVAPTADELTVQVLGKEGYDNSDLTINAGDSVTWVNKDPSGKRMVMTIKRTDDIDALIAGKLFGPDEEWQYTFTEVGTFDFWTEGYGIRGHIVVEE